MLKKILYIFLIISLFLTSCTAIRPIANKPEVIQETLNKGDYIRVYLKNGEIKNIIVVDVTDEAIIGEITTILFSEIDRLERRGTAADSYTPICLGALAGGVLGGIVAVYIVVSILKQIWEGMGLR